MVLRNGRKTGLRISIQLFTLVRIRIQLFTSMRIRIRILFVIKVMRICDHWSTDPPGLHVGRPLPSTAPFWASKLLNFDLRADQEPDFPSNVDPDPASKTNADPGPKPWWKMVVSVADLDPGSGVFLTPGPGSEIRNRFFPDPGSQTHIFEWLVTNFWVKSSIML